MHSPAARVSSIALGVALVMTTTPIPAVADEPSPLYALVDAAAQRLQIAEPVAASKWTSGGSIEDPVRERQVIDAVTAMARDQGVDPTYVERAFREQIDATVAVEYGLFTAWKFDPAGAPLTAPNLADSRTAIDGYNRTIVKEIGAQWDSLHSPGCAAELDGVRNAVVANRGLDDLYQRGLTFATKSYCR